MALQQIAGLGQSIWYPQPAGVSFPPATANSTAIAATGDKLAFCGRVWTPTRGNKNISRVGIRFGSAITKAGGSALTISLQDVSLTAGAPMQPDETQDQTVTVANAAITASTWLRTGALSATRTVSPGALLAVVVEYDGAGRLGADSITLSVLNVASQVQNLLQTTGVSKVGGTWAVFNGIPNVVLEFDDGTFGTLAGAIPWSAINTHTFKQDTASNDEFALAFQVPFSCKVDGLMLPISVTANTSDFSFILYDGTAAMTGGTITVDANSVTAAGAARAGFANFSQEITLVANHQYYLAVQPTQTTNTVSVYSFDMNDANHLVCHPGGVNFNYTTRVDAGAWAALTTTRRLVAGLSISSLDDGASSGGMMVPTQVFGIENLQLGV